MDLVEIGEFFLKKHGRNLSMNKHGFLCLIWAFDAALMLFLWLNTHEPKHAAFGLFSLLIFGFLTINAPKKVHRVKQRSRYIPLTKKKKRLE